MAIPAALPFSPRAGGVTVTVRLTPRAGRERIAGLRATPDGTALTVAVNAPPEAGKANGALVAVLAKALRLPQSALRLTHGGKSRNKTVTIDGTPEDLMSQLTALIQEPDRHG